MGRATSALAGVLLALAALVWWITEPKPIAIADLPEHVPDPAAGERVFRAGGCASCHASPVNGKRAKGDDRLLLGGGMELDTPFGVFRVPNISTHDADGIGGWTMLEFVNAMQRGISPNGRHYYPSFPYSSYVKMAAEDVMDLRAYLDTLPAVAGKVADHMLGFPWTIRRGIGAWKMLYLDRGWTVRFESSDVTVERGRALVEGAGHCGECHTPRDRLGGMIETRWLGGAPSLEGEGHIPNITPGGENVAGWTVDDIAYYLESGFTPEFDTVGGSMVAVQENMALLPKADRDAIAAYLKAVPAVQD